MGLLNETLGMVTAPINNAMQLSQQKKLMGIQMEGNKEMANYNQQLALDMWNKTNYEAQTKHMKDAGLNVGLMYKGAGTGGTTAGAGTAGAVNAGTADNNQAGMALQMGLQTALQEAQVKNIEADTRNKDVKTAKEAGVETREIEARIPTYGKNIEKTDEEIKEIASKIGVNEETIRNIITQENKNKAETKLTQSQTDKTKAETNKINVMLPIEKTLLQSNIQLNKQQKEKIGAEIYKIKTELDQKDIELQQKDTQLSQEEWKIRNEATKIKIQALLQQSGLNIQDKAVNAKIATDIMNILSPKQGMQIHNY